MSSRSSALTALAWTDNLAAALEPASMAIARLDARISASSCVSAWQMRAAWSGFARALQLQGHEIDEIDVFAWGCGVHLPARPRLPTLDDPFAGFPRWQTQFADNARRHWREDLGVLVTPDADYAGPRLVRALEALRQISCGEPTIDAWLTLPLLLQRLGFTRALLPCLVVGEKRLRCGQPADESVLRRLLKSLGEAAATGLDRIEALERARLRAGRAIAAAHRAGALPRLAARLQSRPVASPQAIAREFRITISGAGKLLARAAEAGLVREVRGTQAWKLYLAPDLAVAFGFVDPPRGRPRRDPPPLPHDRDLAAILAAFDEDMAAFDLAHESVGGAA